MAERDEASRAADLAPGLRIDPGKPPRWRATKAAIAAGYPVKSVNLSTYADDPRALAGRCQRLQAEMLAWLAGWNRAAAEFDGTIRSLIDLYLHDADSPYRRLKPASRAPYEVYAAMMRHEVGELLIDRCDGRAVRRWFAAWSAPATPGGPPRIAKARMAVAVLKAVLTFGIQCRHAGCAEFRAVLGAMDFPARRPRQAAPTAAQVIAAIAAAHARGHAPAALAYAIQFEGLARQWDVIGQWVPLSERVASSVIDRGMKWIGPTWANVDENLILRVTPSKTETTTGREVVIDLGIIYLTPR